MDTSDITKSLIEIVNKRLWFKIALWTLLSSMQYLFYYFQHPLFYKLTPQYILIQLCAIPSICLTISFLLIRQIALDKKWNDAINIIISYYLKSILTIIISILIASIFNFRIRYYLLTMAILPLLQFLYGLRKNKKAAQLALSELL
jgi:hypothetical protein